MRLLMKLIFVGILWASPMQAMVHFEDGYDLYQKWLEYKKCRAGLPCLTYSDGFYKGYVLGMADAYGAFLLSIPEDISVGTVCMTVGQHMEEHQDELDHAASLIVFNALSQAFPKKQTEIRYQWPKKSMSD